MEPFLAPDGSQLHVQGAPVWVRRSSRRRRTVSARREGTGVLVLLPTGLGHAAETEWVHELVGKVLAGGSRRRAPRGDRELQARAVRLAREVLDPVVGREVRPSSVRWVTNQNHRWGSCSTDTGAIRLSHRLQEMPDWVVDHVLVHELAHLVEAHHTARFHALVAGFEHTERAKGYLEGWIAGRHHSHASPPSGDGGEAWEVD